MIGPLVMRRTVPAPRWSASPCHVLARVVEDRVHAEIRELHDVVVAFLAHELIEALGGELGAIQHSVLREAGTFILKIDRGAVLLVAQAQARAFLQEIERGRVEELIEEEGALQVLDALAVAEPVAEVGRVQAGRASYLDLDEVDRR